MNSDYSVVSGRFVWFTLGPATLGRIPEAIAAGANGVRYTLSYADLGYHVEMAAIVRDAAARLKTHVLAIADLPGIKQRLGNLGDQPIYATAGDRLAIGGPLSDELVTVKDLSFFAEVSTGCRIIVGDGGVILEVCEVDRESAVVTVVDGGRIEPNRGLTVVGGAPPADELADIDYEFAAELKSVDCFDIVAASFVGGPTVLKQLAEVLGEERPLVMAKIETAGGVDNIEEIVRVSDMIMAGRGDLALAIPWTRLYAAVSRVARVSVAAGRPWILATQLFEGLSEFGFPLRAEMCDLPAWIEQGAAGAMLSKETAFGARPIDCIAAVRSLVEVSRKW